MQGRGLGKEMREAVLHLAFAGLGAERALSEAFTDNAPSRGVSISLGYVPNGTTWALRQDEPAPMDRLLLTRDAWMRRQRLECTIHGLDACLPMLGLT
jgi:RimJ/RimL family protein N-acetyltransferase